MVRQLGKLKRLDPGEVWANEAKDFTPWLRDNIDLLCDALGVELEITESEGEVGDFYADLVGREVESGRVVVIENQLGPTDHDHLGKLMTYAAGLNAGLAVWVATDFREEHRRVLQWLNSMGGEEKSFFGVELEVVCIGDSPPAPDFDVVVKPIWHRPPVKLTDKQKAYRDFFSALLQVVKQRLPGLTSANVALPQNWFGFPSGRTGFMYGVSFTSKSKLRVDLYIDTGDKDRNKACFDTLVAERSGIEAEIGEELSWERLDDRRASRVAVFRTGSIADPPEKLAELRDWAVDMLGRFTKVFGRRVVAL